MFVNPAAARRLSVDATAPRCAWCAASSGNWSCTAQRRQHFTQGGVGLGHVACEVGRQHQPPARPQQPQALAQHAGGIGEVIDAQIGDDDLGEAVRQAGRLGPAPNQFDVADAMIGELAFQSRHDRRPGIDGVDRRVRPAALRQLDREEPRAAADVKDRRPARQAPRPPAVTRTAPTTTEARSKTR